ncbi:TPA: 50S ribosomal protein L3 [Candidatus Poribacteria bacterium]|nr:50S ribosomal protein L3 [Candidatus Poribacteria bacterium]
MSDGILGRKIGMTRIFSEDGESTPVTVVEAGPCPIVQVKTQDKDGYNALQLGFGQRRANTGSKRKNIINNPERGHLAKSNAIKEVEADERHPRRWYGPRFLREIRTDNRKTKPSVNEVNIENLTLGETVDVSIFSEGDLVDVTSTSKGRGFTGVVKRWGFKGGKKSHGGEKDLRRIGSIGASASPSRVFKGKRMAGRHGGKRVTVQNLKVLKSDPERNLLVLRGTVPGPPNGFLIIRKAVKSET